MAKQAIPDAKRLNAFAMDPDKIVIIGLDTDDGSKHALYDPRIKFPLDEGMVLNVMRVGVLEPVLVRKNGVEVEVVAGRRRVRAAREANRRLREDGLEPWMVPVIVRRDKDANALGILVAENENREDDDPIMRAEKAQRMLDHGHDEADIAIYFGKSTQFVRNLLALLELSPKVQGAVRARKISASAAIELRDLPREDQDAKLEELLATGAVGVAELQRQRRERTKSSKAPSNGSTEDDSENRGKKVPVKVLRKVADDEEFVGSLSPDAQALLKWILGSESHAKRVKGLTRILNALSGGSSDEADAEE